MVYSMKYTFDMLKEIKIIFWYHKLIFRASKNVAIKLKMSAPSRNILIKALYCILFLNRNGNDPVCIHAYISNTFNDLRNTDGSLLCVWICVHMCAKILKRVLSLIHS